MQWWSRWDLQMVQKIHKAPTIQLVTAFQPLRVPPVRLGAAALSAASCWSQAARACSCWPKAVDHCPQHLRPGGGQSSSSVCGATLCIGEELLPLLPLQLVFSGLSSRGALTAGFVFL